MIDKRPASPGDKPPRRFLDAPGARPPEKREGQRIAKVMARAGLCSRRDAEGWIAEGRVVVNGKKLDSPAFNVSPSDDVRVDGKPLAAPERTRLFLYNKPRGLVTTARDPDGRPTIFENLPEDLPRLIAVGRLDINTEGLLLLTNDGGLARVLELPATGWLRRYRVRAHGEIEQTLLNPLSEGVTIDGVGYAGIEAVLDRSQGSNVWITMGLREGKNREIKKVLEHLGLAVNRLIRISFGPFQLGELEEGAVAEVRTRVLRDQLGAKLAREAGVDFDAPSLERGESPPLALQERRSPRVDRKPRPGGFEDREERAKTDPKTSYGPKMRKHVSALRSERKDAESGPRKRIERGAATDRKGREVKVERLLPTIQEARRRAAVAARSKEKEHERGASKESRPGRGSFRPGDRTKLREGRRFETTRDGETPVRAKPSREDAPGRGPRSRDDSKPFRRSPPSSGAARDGERPRGDGRRPRADGDGKRDAAKLFREGATGRGPRSREDSKPFHKGPQGKGSARDGGGKRDSAKPFRKGPPRGASGGKPPAGGSRPPRRG
jgi:23S rRNA pseudouridine2605 synthase